MITDHRVLLEKVVQALSGEFEVVAELTNTAAGIEELGTAAWDVVLCDNDLHRMSAPAAFDLLREVGCRAPFILIAGSITESKAARIISSGVDACVGKDRLEHLPGVLRRALSGES